MQSTNNILAEAGSITNMVSMGSMLVSAVLFLLSFTAFYHAPRIVHAECFLCDK